MGIVNKIARLSFTIITNTTLKFIDFQTKKSINLYSVNFEGHLRLTALNRNTHLQQYRRITNLLTFKNIALSDKSPGRFLSFLIILILKQDLTIYTIHIKGG